MSLKLNQKLVFIAPFDLVIPALPMPVSVIVNDDVVSISVPIDNVTDTLALPAEPGFNQHSNDDDPYTVSSPEHMLKYLQSSIDSNAI